MKKGILLTVFVAMFLLVDLAAAQTDDDDTQLWNETTVEFSLSKEKNISGVVIGNLRVTDDIGYLSDKRIGFGIKFKPKKYLTVTPSYIFRTQSRPGPNRYEHRLRLDLVPKKSFKKFSIENRNRFEHRMKTAGRTDNTFYRNRTKLKIPVKKNNKTFVTPFFSNDTYFDLQETRIHRNDTVGGISRKINKKLTTNFFYQYRRNFQSSTKHVHIIGIDLKIKLY